MTQRVKKSLPNRQLLVLSIVALSHSNATSALAISATKLNGPAGYANPQVFRVISGGHTFGGRGETYDDRRLFEWDERGSIVSNVLSPADFRIYDVSEAGVWVGYRGLDAVDEEPVIVDRGISRTLPLPIGAMAGSVRGGSNVGSYWGRDISEAVTVGGVGRGILWSDGTAELLPNDFRPETIQGIGRVGGMISPVGGTTTPAVYENGTLTALPLPVGTQGGFVRSIFADGRLVVRAGADASSYASEFVWDGSTYNELQLLPGMDAVWTNDANELGFSVGNCGSRAIPWPYVRAAVWNANGDVTDLNSLLTTPGITLTNAISISDDGYILSIGVEAGQPTGEYNYYLLSPIALPEPTLLAAFASGSALFIRRRCR